MKFKNTLYRIKSRPDTAKENIHEFKETAMETIREAQRENTSPKPMMGKTRGADYCMFTSSRAQTLKF